MVRPARLCPYCGEINEPTVLMQHTVSCERPVEYDAAMERESVHFAVLVAFAFIVACLVVPLALVLA